VSRGIENRFKAYPVLVARGAVELVLRVGEERRAGNVPLVGAEEEDVGARRVHLVRLPRVCEGRERVSFHHDARTEDAGDSRIVSFWTVSIWSASSSWSKTWHKSITTDSWICEWAGSQFRNEARGGRRLQTHLLPQVSAEDLDERDLCGLRASAGCARPRGEARTDLERRDLAVHEDSSKIKLNLESDVDVRAVDRRR
jgi:hypothetical protein